jgi:hypothetical protein
VVTQVNAQNQDMSHGVITYISARSTYVKFRTTKDIAIGDTLYKANQIPCLKVQNKSSISCMTEPISGCVVQVGDTLLFRINEAEVVKTNPVPSSPTTLPVRTPDVDTVSVAAPSTKAPLVNRPNHPRYMRPRVSVASYNNFAEVQPTSTWRLTWQAQGALKQNQRVSIDQYVVYRRSYDVRDTFLNSFANAFKVYSLAAQYQAGKAGTIAIGRKINQRFSSIGATDGLQYERALKRGASVGVLLGSRPRLADYAIDFNLLQGGVWLGFEKPQKGDQPNKMHWQSTLGAIEQRNGSATDRRFFYTQHQVSVGRFSTFGSAEVDFFQNIRDTVSLKPILTNTYLQIRYRFNQKSDVSFAYDNRRNIIFYESYKLFIDQVIDNETRHGFRMSWNYRLWKWWSVGTNGSMRLHTSNDGGMKNINGFITCSQIPGIKASLTLTAGLLNTAYLENTSYSARLAKSIWKNKVNLELNYRMLDYAYLNESANTSQHIYGLNVSTMVSKHLSMFFFAEQTADIRNYDFTRLQTKLMWRF